MTEKSAIFKMSHRANYGESETRVTVYPESIDTFRSRGIDVKIPAKYLITDTKCSPGVKKNPVKVTVTWEEGSTKSGRRLHKAVINFRRENARKERKLTRDKARKLKQWFNSYSEDEDTVDEDIYEEFIDNFDDVPTGNTANVLS